MKIMKDKYLPALVALPLAWILVYIPHFIKAGCMVHRKRLEYDNVNPRSTNPDDFGEYSGIIKRAMACHYNALESFPAFAAALLLSRMQKVKPMTVAKLSVRYILCRILYTVFYLAGTNQVVAGLRSLAWVGGMHSIWRLFALSL